MALADVNVLDLTQIIAGPYATMLLADLGASVIKVEDPTTAESRRQPAILSDGAPVPFNAWWLYLNRNKRSITLNLRQPRGVELFHQLVRETDVVVEGFRAGVAEALGIGYERLKSTKADLVYASVSAYGRTGPDGDLPGYDLVAQARSGFMSVTGEADGPALRAGISVSDYLAGLHVAVGVIAALRHRDRTGVGQAVDISLLDCLFGALDGYPELLMNTGVAVKRSGVQHPAGLPAYQTFQAVDGPIVVAAPPGPNWVKLANAIGHPELVATAEQLTAEWQLANRDRIRAAVASWVADRTRQAAVTQLRSAGVAVDYVQEVAEAVEDPQLKARDMIVETEFPPIGKVKTVGSALKLSRTPTGVRAGPPSAGEHNFEVFSGLGLRDEEIVELMNDGVI